MSEFDRATGIGGSDVAAILGISPWRTRFDVWLEKTANPAYRPKQVTPAMRWGTLLEPVIADEWAMQNGVVLEPCDRLHDPVHPFLYANIDRKWAGEFDGHPPIFEAKTASDDRDWRDGVPDYYMTQVQHYLSISGAPFCDVVVLFPGGNMKTYRVEPDPDVIKWIRQECVRFWNDEVLAGVPPETGDLSLVEARYPAELYDAYLQAPEDVALAIEEYVDIKQRIADLNEELGQRQAAIQHFMGQSSGVVYRGYTATWKTVRPWETVDWKKVAHGMQTLDVARFNRLVRENTKTVAPGRQFKVTVRKEGDDAAS